MVFDQVSSYQSIGKSYSVMYLLNLFLDNGGRLLFLIIGIILPQWRRVRSHPCEMGCIQSFPTPNQRSTRKICACCMITHKMRDFQAACIVGSVGIAADNFRPNSQSESGIVLAVSVRDQTIVTHGHSQHILERLEIAYPMWGIQVLRQGCPLSSVQV